MSTRDNGKMRSLCLELVICLLLGIATLTVYWQVRNHNFVNYDDREYVTDNPHVQAGLTRESIIWAFTATHASNWHPLTWLSHMLDCQLYRLNAGGHHFTSLLLHISNTLLLFLLLKRMTRALWRSAFVAGLFSLHPLHVESVAWVAERKDVLSTLFWIVTMWVYVRYVERQRLGRYVLVLGSFALGLMCKPMLVTLPFVLVLIDYWPLGRLKSGFVQAQSQKTVNLGYKMSIVPRLVWEKAPLFALAAASCVVTFLSQQTALAPPIPFRVRAANALVSYVTYIGKMVWPHNLAVFYPHLGASLPMWWAVGAALLLLSISVLALRAARRSPYLATGWLWYLGTLVPVIGLVQVGSQAMADRYMYVPSIGLFIIIAWGVADFASGWRYRSCVLTTSAGAVFLALTICTCFQVRHWKDSISLFKDAINVTSNNWLAHYSLGDALERQGRLGCAISHYATALRIKPNFVIAQNQLGIALCKQGKPDDAIGHFFEALRIKPDYADAHYNLGVTLAKQGRLSDAIGHFFEALRIKPDHAGARYSLGLTLAKQGRLSEAVSHFFEALRIKPDYADAHYSLGLAMADQGRLKDAVGHFSAALQIEPDDALAHNQLGMALCRQGKPDEAIAHFRKALEIEPDYQAAQRNLKLALRLAGKD